MSFVVLVVAVVLAAGGSGLAVALVMSRRQKAESATMVAELRQELEAGRDASVKSAIDTVVTMAREQLGSELTAGTRELDQRNELVGQRLTAMDEQLGKVTALVQRLETERERKLGELSQELKRTGESTLQLTEATQTLRQALSGSQSRGQWGERMADDVLQIAGLVEGVNYRRQQTVDGGRPDFTFLLPGDQLLHMDVKFPLDNYLRHLEADNDADAERYRDAFLKDVRARLKELTKRGYVDGPGTLDFQLLFIPNEHIYAFVHQHDDGLIDLAMSSGIVLCSPLTLLAVLSLVRQAVDNFALERTSHEILEVLGTFTTQWDKFSDQMEKVSRGLDTTRRAYDDLLGTRRRQLERQLDRIDDLRRSRGLEDGTASPPLRPVPADAESA